MQDKNNANPEKNKVEFVSAESSACLQASSSGYDSGTVRYHPSVALGSLLLATSDPQSVVVSLSPGWSSLFCPACFPSAQGPGVVHLTSDSTSSGTSTCFQRVPLMQLGG